MVGPLRTDGSSSDQTSRSAAQTILKFQRLLKSLRPGVADDLESPGGAEQLALVLSNHGLQRMTARVLATLLFTEQPTITAGELADRLQASTGAISAR